MGIMKYLFQRSNHRVAFAAVAGIVSGVCHVVLLSLVNRAATRNDMTMMVVWVFVGLCVLMPITRVIAQILLARLSQDAIFDLRLWLCRQILGAPLRVLENAGIPTLLSSLTDDVMVIGSAFTIFPILCTQVAVLIACLIYLGFVSWPALVVTLLMLLAGVAGFKVLMGRSMKAWAHVRGSQDEMLSHFNALTEGIKELKLHQERRRSFIGNMLNLTANEYRAQNIVAVGYYAGAGGWGQLVQFSLLGLIALAMPYYGLMPREAVVPAMMVILYITSPIDILSSNLPTLGRAKVALDAIRRLGISLEEKSIERDADNRFSRHAPWESLELAGVTHNYKREGEPNDFVLGPIDLSFEPGQLVFLVGGNGSGKTTLAKLIAGLYAPGAGTVTFDDTVITDENRDDYRQMFSMVFADFYLFESLIGLDSPTLDAQAQAYLETLRLASNVQVTNGKLSTLELSQGQRKRLALLTAYLEDRPIYVFDEWAADQDPSFKRFFYHVLLPELKARGKTIIAISHDDAYYHLADRIIKLTSGQLEFDQPIGTVTTGLTVETVSL
jgi:putative ATP-binding cassette transporter